MLKKIDKTSLLLYFFVLFTISVFMHLQKMNKNVSEYNKYHDTAYSMQVLNQEFNNFLLKDVSFINYDIINKSTLDFEKKFNFLINKKENLFYTPQYLKLLKNLKIAYKLKHADIEYFKSQNTQLVYLMQHLFDLNNLILNSKEINQNTVSIVNKSFLLLMRFYINDTISNDKIFKNLKYLKSSLNKKYVLEVSKFLQYFQINLKVLIRFKKISENQKQDNVKINLIQIHNYLDKNENENNQLEKTIVTLLFIIILVIMFILILMNRHSRNLRDELFAFKTAVENGDNTVVITDLEGKITYVNETAIKETGYTKDELLGENPRLLKSGLTPLGTYDDMYEKLESGKSWRGEFINKRKDDSFYHEKAFVMPMFQDKKIVSYLAIKLNITDFIEAKRKIENLAYTDTLTSIPNRVNIENYLSNRIYTASRDGSKLALLFMDLDNFKSINDTLGHNVGDELLVATTKKIKNLIRTSDILARLGGDEFVLVVENFDDINTISYLCKKILNSFNEPIKTAKHNLHISISIGISIFPDDAKDISSLFSYADIAMYKAKDAGKNRFNYYKKEFSTIVDSRLEIEQSLKEAMNHNEFYMMYQPQYLLKSKDIVGLEALARWNSSTLGNIPPDKFIPICEETGYILDLGLFIFTQACSDFLQMKKHCPFLKTISINVSAIQLYQDAFIQSIVTVVNKVGINPSYIILEITESKIMKNVAYSMQVLAKLKKEGFSLSIDDFGTGYSSLNYLKQFPIDELKIDKSFVDNLPNNKDDVSITKAILALSHTMDYYNVAEGIENLEQENFLKENNCLIGQGYYFSKPLEKKDFINFALRK